MVPVLVGAPDGKVEESRAKNIFEVLRRILGKAWCGRALLHR